MEETIIKLTLTLPNAMEKAKVDASSLASKLKVDESRIQSFLSGKEEPSFKELLTISQTLGVTTDYLLTGKEFESK